MHRHVFASVASLLVGVIILGCQNQGQLDGGRGVRTFPTTVQACVSHPTSQYAIIQLTLPDEGQTKVEILTNDSDWAATQPTTVPVTIPGLYGESARKWRGLFGRGPRHVEEVLPNEFPAIQISN